MRRPSCRRNSPSTPSTRGLTTSPSRCRPLGRSRSPRPIRRPRASGARRRTSQFGRSRGSPGTLRPRSRTARRWGPSSLTPRPVCQVSTPTPRPPARCLMRAAARRSGGIHPPGCGLLQRGDFHHHDQRYHGPPMLRVTDPGGSYNGIPFPASATITGVESLPASSLEGMAPTLSYYVGSTVSAASLGSALPWLRELTPSWPLSLAPWTIRPLCPRRSPSRSRRSRNNPCPGLVGRLVRLRTTRQLHGNGECRRRPANRLGHILRRCHPAGHCPTQ